jgi:hypothetical protein
MIEHTEQEIKEKVTSIWKEKRDAWQYFQVTVTMGEKIHICIEQMYEYVPCTFSMLEQLSIFFDTKSINFDNGNHYNGCETCDYGSSYEVDIYIG